MFTANFRPISPALKSNSGRYLSVSLSKQTHVQKSVCSVKLIKTCRCSMSPTELSVKIVKGASDIKNGAMLPSLEVGVPVFILKDDKILFGRRRSTSIASNSYGLPGGHLEFGESFEECAAREVKEETGLDIKNIKFLTATNNVLSDSVHLVAIYMRAQLSDPSQIPQNVEPDRCEGWNWYDLKNLPLPMYSPLREMLQGGFNPFSTES